MKNWAGNYEYRAATLREPATIEELQQVVAAARRIHAVGSRHSFNDIADSPAELVSLARMPRRIEIDRDAMTVRVDGALRYGELCGALERAGLALHNLASLPHISVAGACATGTHGSGVQNGSLSSAVVGMELVQADGQLAAVDGASGSDTLEAAVVSLGALGVVTALTLRVEPTYRVRQDVYENLPIPGFVDDFASLAAAGDSVSFFTDWTTPTIDQVWVKRRVEGNEDLGAEPELFGARRATAARHPIAGMSPAACTTQLGEPGPWFERLPHFRMDHTPSSGDELQTEYVVPFDDAADAFLALDRFREELASLVLVTEIRTIAADRLWLSPSSERQSAAFHFTWRPDEAAVRAILPRVEQALRPFAPRPHWGKLFSIGRDELRDRYPRLPDFADLAVRWDPAGTFRNDYLERTIL
jgi:xylitol oxidase